MRRRPNTHKDPPPLSGKEELIMLTMLSQERYGTEMIQIVYEATDGKVDIQFGSIYPMLNKLEKRSLIKNTTATHANEDLTQRGSHRRQYYMLTDYGYAALKQVDIFRTSVRNMQNGMGPCF